MTTDPRVEAAAKEIHRALRSMESWPCEACTHIAEDALRAADAVDPLAAYLREESA